MEHIIVVGAGIAGLTAAATLEKKGFSVTVLEKNTHPGGNVSSWDRLFPEGRPAGEILSHAASELKNVDVITGVSVEGIEKKDDRFTVRLSSGKDITGDAVLLASGFSLFDAHLKEEYGYGIYDNVFTNADLESMFTAGKVTDRNGQAPKRVAFVHCVGSRDEKIGNRYCSKVCCATAVKQAGEVKQLYPEAEVFCFYMDLRMYDLAFEDMYFNAQTLYGVRFVRGRLCEAAEGIDKRVVLKVEDTLAGQTMNLSVDMLVLMSGMTAPSDTARIAGMLGVRTNKEGFLQPEDVYLGRNVSSAPGVFLAGTCTGPKTIPETVADARAACGEIEAYLAEKSVKATGQAV